jgi:flagellar motor switch protein FliM
MTRQVAHDVLRRMASPPPPAPEDVPITSSRAIRLAITRAADKTHGFSLSVSSLREEVLSLDGLLEALEPSLMLIGMKSDDRVAGLAALDLNMRAAVIEVQTIGNVLEAAPEERAPTGTDARMAEPIVSAFLTHLQATATRTALDGWGLGFEVGDRIETTRAAGLILDDGQYRLIRLTLDLGIGDRQAEMTIALPSRDEDRGKVMEPEVTGDWESRFRTVVDGSPAHLDAVLHRFKLQLQQAENLTVGQILPLPGCTVSSVKLMAKDGRKVATARLGQSGGMRAVRIEAAPQLNMSEMDYIKEEMELGGLPALDATRPIATSEPAAGEVVDMEKPARTPMATDVVDAANREVPEDVG